MSRLSLRRASGAALAIAAVALGGSAYADAAPKAHAAHGHGATIRLLEASETVQPAFVDNGAPGPSAGDVVVVRDGVLRSDGSPAGTFNQVCTLVKAVGGPLTSEYECTGSLALATGTITMAGPFNPAKAEQSAALTGGTGAYRTARGEVIVRSEADEIVVELAG